MFDKTPAAVLDYHRSMLGDRVRTGALARAILAIVNKGDRVLDLGCGTGILACFACRAGARRVYAIESEPTIELARSLCRVNGFADRVVFIHELSTRVELPEQVDVIVTETIGNMALEEGILGSALDARRRFLRPGGILVPRSLTLFACPVELPTAYRSVSAWDELPYGLDFAPARTLAAHNPAWVEIPIAANLAPPSDLGRIDLTKHETAGFYAKTSVRVSRPGTCHGLGVWFEAKLTASESLSNAPTGRSPSWQCGFLPLERPLEVSAGDLLRLELRAEVDGSLWLWRVSHIADDTDDGLDKDGGLMRSTLAGRFLSMKSLRKGAADYVPRLSLSGGAQAFILGQMDGCTSVAEIAAKAAHGFPSLFKTPEKALDLVRRLSRNFA